jgi:hypothetical protein
MKQVARDCRMCLSRSPHQPATHALSIHKHYYPGEAAGEKGMLRLHAVRLYGGQCRFGILLLLTAALLGPAAVNNTPLLSAICNSFPVRFPHPNRAPAAQNARHGTIDFVVNATALAHTLLQLCAARPMQTPHLISPLINPFKARQQRPAQSSRGGGPFFSTGTFTLRKNHFSEVKVGIKL